jgi:ABC-2 type transport system permease protein
LWATIAVGFGLAEVLVGAWRVLARTIVEGQLDYYLVLPKSPLWHALMSGASTTGWGDLVFGVIVFSLWGDPTWQRCLLFAAAALACGCLLLGTGIVYNSLALFVGNAEALALQVENAVIHFGTYPGSIFGGGIRAILFTVIPAGFLNHMPVEVMRGGNLGFLALSWGAAVAWVASGQLLFALGLHRYESGNLIGPRL